MLVGVIFTFWAGHITKLENWVFKIFGMGIPYIENYMPMKNLIYIGNYLEKYLGY